MSLLRSIQLGGSRSIATPAHPRGQRPHSGTGHFSSAANIGSTGRWRRLRRPSPLLLRKLTAALLVSIAAVLVVADWMAPAHGQVRIAVSASALPSGHTIGDADVIMREVPQSLVPEGAVQDVAAINGKMVATPVATGEIITENRLVGPSLAAQLTGAGNSKVVAITLSDTGIISVLQVGDSVDVIAHGATASAAPIAHGARVITISEKDVVLVALPAGAAEVVAAHSLSSQLALVLTS